MTASFRSVPFLSATIVALSFAFVVAAFCLVIVNASSSSGMGADLSRLAFSTAALENAIVVLSTDIGVLESNVTIALNETAVINATLTEQLAYLNNYTCDQIERINGITPPCEGNIVIEGAGNVTVAPQPQYGIYVNGSILEDQLLADGNTITFIATALSITDMELATLNMESVKTLNNVTVNAQGNIDLVGQCGVDVYVSNSTGNVVIDTCRIENNVTTLIIFLNDTYYAIQNETNVINATLISVSQLLIQLQAQLDAIKPLLVRDINGVTPTAQNLDLVAGPGIAIGGGGSNGQVQVNNSGIVTVNGLNNNGAVTFVADPGITIQQTAPNIINVSNTFADIFQTPCTVRSSASVGGHVYFIATTPQPTFWTGFSFPNVKSDPSCPDIFFGNKYIQQEGIWTLQVNIQLIVQFNQGINPPFDPDGLGAAFSVGIQDDVTLETTWINSYYPTLAGPTDVIGFGPSPQTFLVGQVTMNGYVIPVGRQFTFVVYYFNANGKFLTWSNIAQVISVRIA